MDNTKKMKYPNIHHKLNVRYKHVILLYCKIHQKGLNQAFFIEFLYFPYKEAHMQSLLYGGIFSAITWQIITMARFGQGESN